MINTDSIITVKSRDFNDCLPGWTKDSATNREPFVVVVYDNCKRYSFLTVKQSKDQISSAGSKAKVFKDSTVAIGLPG